VGLAACLAVAAMPVPSSAEVGALAPVGDAARGRALYIGAVPLERGGAPCGACHAIGGQGAAFAASLGPDLATTFDGVPPDALDGLLSDLPFPSMVPVYEGRALTPRERADLAAFLVASTGRPLAGAGGVLGLAAAIAAAGVAGLGLAARRRRGSVRAEMLERATGARGGGR
jgi:mono/diheme cytochrome c family protein